MDVVSHRVQKLIAVAVIHVSGEHTRPIACAHHRLCLSPTVQICLKCLLAHLVTKKTKAPLPVGHLQSGVLCFWPGALYCS